LQQPHLLVELAGLIEQGPPELGRADRVRGLALDLSAAG